MEEEEGRFSRATHPKERWKDLRRRSTLSCSLSRLITAHDTTLGRGRRARMITGPSKRRDVPPQARLSGLHHPEDEEPPLRRRHRVTKLRERFGLDKTTAPGGELNWINRS